MRSREANERLVGVHREVGGCNMDERPSYDSRGSNLRDWLEMLKDALRKNYQDIYGRLGTVQLQKESRLIHGHNNM